MGAPDAIPEMDGKASLDPERKADLNQQVRKLFDRFGPQSEKILFEVMPRKVRTATPARALVSGV